MGAPWGRLRPSQERLRPSKRRLIAEVHGERGCRARGGIHDASSLRLAGRERRRRLAGASAGRLRPSPRRPVRGRALAARADPLLADLPDGARQRRARARGERGGAAAARRPRVPRLARVPRLRRAFCARTRSPRRERSSRGGTSGSSNRDPYRARARADLLRRFVGADALPPHGGLDRRARARDPGRRHRGVRRVGGRLPRGAPAARLDHRRRASCTGRSSRSRRPASRSSASRRGGTSGCTGAGTTRCRRRSPRPGCCSRRRSSPSGSRAAGTSRGGSGTS